MNASDLPDETLFEGVLKCRTPEERAAYLDQACAGQPQLRQQLEALLAAHDRSGEFLEPPAAARPTIKLDLAPEESPGTMIGRYKLLQKIGEGGMGVVYMAEQTEPVVRKVALKIIKLGMDTKQVVARFEAERQALALMDHPNIAKVLDAGTTGTPVAAGILPAVEPGFQPGGKGDGGFGVIEQSEAAAGAGTSPGGKMPPSTAGETPAATLSAGRPYFVMELVHGVPITEYCDKNKLTTQERLELFIPVCQAIQHAHQKGIIHRDIKPSNVMVTLHDGVPVPKVIDFGVAKATNQRLTEKTLFTHYAQMIGTPAYMSPEQAEMSGLDIDTRSDIYGLGVLLYELLTGTTPFDVKELLSKGYAEMQRIIAEQEPVKPSTRMSTLTDEQRTVVTTHRNTDASALRKVLQGDLDWIVMKCLEKDRTRRYETSNGLAADLRRHLSNELITARPPTTGYLVKKLIKRNKLAFAATSAVAASLVIGIALTTWQAVLAKRAAHRARQAEQRAMATVEELRSTAPAFAEQARALVAQSKFDEAIAKLDYTIQLRPDVVDYLVFKANLLQCQFKLAEAAAAYRAVLKVVGAEPRAKANLKLTEELFTAQSTNQGKLSSQELAKLLSAMQTEQRSAAELLPASQALGKEKDILLAYWLERLKDLPIPAEKPLKERLTLADSGRLVLDLSGTSISDLSPLAGMPLGWLSLDGCRTISDLSPLRGLPLRTLSLNGTAITSLEPLRTITTLVILDLQNTKVASLDPLRGFQLQNLVLSGCGNITDVQPLAGMPLTRLYLRGTRITSLAPLRGMPLTVLDVTSTPVFDFENISGCPLERLLLQDVGVTDLFFLKDMPLKSLALANSLQVRGYSVLQQIKTMETLMLPDNIWELPEEELMAIEALKTHPKLRQITNRPTRGGSVETVTASKNSFWPTFDAYLAMYRGQYAVAEQLFLAELKESRDQKGDTHSITENALQNLIRCQVAGNRLDEAAVSLRDLIDLYLKIGRPPPLFDEAIARQMLAGALVWKGDLPAYRKACAEVVERFAGVSEPSIAGIAIKVSVLAPDSGVETKELDKWQDTALKPHDNSEWDRMSIALREYRDGRWDESARSVQLITSSDAAFMANLDLISAMNEFQRGNVQAARKKLAQARESMKSQEAKLQRDDGLRQDWFVMNALAKEATALIEGVTTSKPAQR